jgi:AhpD family alkylhydroperoxidase
MTHESVEDFNAFRSAQNEKILKEGELVTKRIFNLDANAFKEGALSVDTKEAIGLACSLVLRCDDCVRYHLQKCKEIGMSDAQIREAMSISLLIGGTIVIPHLRRAYAFLEELNQED